MGTGNRFTRFFLKLKIKFITILKITKTFASLGLWVIKEYFVEIYKTLILKSNEPHENVIKNPKLSKYLDTLSIWEKQILIMHYNYKVSFETIAKKIKLSEQEVIKIHNNIIKKMKAEGSINQLDTQS